VESLKKMSIDCGNGVKMDFVLIPAGTFMMGAKAGDPGYLDKMGPVHRVTITKPFWIGITEVTQAQYVAIKGRNPSHTKGDNNPVEFMSWQDAVNFCKLLSEKSGKTRRLPTDAEWEYACRAGTSTPWYWGNKPSEISYYAIHKGNAAGLNVSAAVGSKLPNQWGLYDMIGNVWELVRDIDTIGYDQGDAVDPTGGKADVGIKIARGGSMNYGPDQCNAAYRLAQGLTITLFETGFRVVCEEQPK